jgi:hypothetical protein
MEKPEALFLLTLFGGSNRAISQVIIPRLEMFTTQYQFYKIRVFLRNVKKY